jgi:toxin ParE1/3/4
MKAYRLTVAADGQLQEIWRYSRDRWGAAQANAYFAVVEAALHAAIKTPALLRPRADLGEAIVARKVGSHVAYGFVHEEVFVVVAVLHARMDPKRHLLRDE